LLVESLSPEETSQAELLSASGLLHSGEAAAIILSKRWSAAVGHLSYDEAKSALDKLSKTSLWISKAILSQAYKALDTIFGKR